jgi:nucleoid-associated protein YgaU
MLTSGPLWRAPIRVLAILGTVTGVAVVVALNLPNPPQTPVATPVPQAAAVPEPAAAAPKTEPASPIKPDFDIARVAPGGSAVFAGRAEPGAKVVVMNAGKALGETVANDQGAWTLVPSDPLPTGAAELSLVAHGPAGVDTAGDGSVLLVVPPASGPAPLPPLAVLAPDAAPSRLLQGPENSAPGRLGLDTVDYDDRGAIRFSGTAPAGIPLRVYVDNKPVGDAVANPGGHWMLSPGQSVDAGMHHLRLDQLTPEGHVAGRVELPFVRETLALSQVHAGQVVVEPGQNLWRLARRVYGNGLRYTVIYQANRDQIRDPRRIYPGQVFTTPAVKTQAVKTPAPRIK